MQAEIPAEAREIVQLEHDAWQALCTRDGADYYREMLAPDAWMVFPFGVLERAEAVVSIAAAEPWERFNIQDTHVAYREQGSAVISYHATAKRAGENEYRAWMTSVYVRGNDGWKMLYHQQSPEMGEGAKAG